MDTAKLSESMAQMILVKFAERDDVDESFEFAILSAIKNRQDGKSSVLAPDYIWDASVDDVSIERVNGKEYRYQFKNPFVNGTICSDSDDRIQLLALAKVDTLLTHIGRISNLLSHITDEMIDKGIL